MFTAGPSTKLFACVGGMDRPPGGGGAGHISAPRGETLLLFPPRHSKPFMASKRARGTAGDDDHPFFFIGSGCEAHSARTRHNTTCIKQGYKTSARRLPLESLARGCSGSRFFCVPGHAVRGRSSHAPSPARPSFDTDHVLYFVISICVSHPLPIPRGPSCPLTRHEWF